MFRILKIRISNLLRVSILGFRICPARGFTLLEMLAVIMIMGFFVAMVIGRFSSIKGDAAITTTLSEMKSIKEAIRDRFYPDLGLIPEDLGPDGIPDHLGPDGIPDNGDEVFDSRPEFSVKFLCLKDDSGDEQAEMSDFLLAYNKPSSLLKWNRYSSRGWRGPYIEQEVSHDYDGLVGEEMVFWPIIVNSWAEYWENRAQSEEDEKDPGWEARADAYRSNKCYRIFGGQNRNLAQIVSYGTNGEADCDVVIGTDANDYVCIKAHIPVAVNNRPITGADWADFWALDNTQTGNAWVDTADYNSFGNDDITMHIFGAEPIQSP